MFQCSVFNAASTVSRRARNAASVGNRSDSLDPLGRCHTNSNSDEALLNRVSIRNTSGPRSYNQIIDTAERKGSGGARWRRYHARLTRTESGRYAIEDLNSANGTFVNDEQIHVRRELHDGDRVRIGEHRWSYRDPVLPLLPPPS